MQLTVNSVDRLRSPTHFRTCHYRSWKLSYPVYFQQLRLQQRFPEVSTMKKMEDTIPSELFQRARGIISRQRMMVVGRTCSIRVNDSTKFCIVSFDRQNPHTWAIRRHLIHHSITTKSSFDQDAYPRTGKAHNRNREKNCKIGLFHKCIVSISMKRDTFCYGHQHSKLCPCRC